MSKVLLAIAFLVTLVSYQNCSDTFDASKLVQSSSNGSSNVVDEIPFDYSSLRLELASISVLQGEPIEARVLTMGKTHDIRMTLSCIDSSGNVSTQAMNPSLCADTNYTCMESSCINEGSARVSMAVHDKTGNKQIDLNSLPISVLLKTKTLVETVKLVAPAQVTLGSNFSASLTTGPEIMNDGAYDVKWTIPAGCTVLSPEPLGLQIGLNCSSLGQKTISAQVTSLNYTGGDSAVLYAGDPKVDFALYAPNSVSVGAGKFGVNIVNMDLNKGIDSIAWTISDPKCALEYPSTTGVINYIHCNGRPASGKVLVTAKIVDDIYYGSSTVSIDVLKGYLSISISGIKDVQKNEGFILISSLTAYNKPKSEIGLKYDWTVCDKPTFTQNSVTSTGIISCSAYSNAAKVKLKVYNDDYEGEVSAPDFKVFRYGFNQYYLANTAVTTLCNTTIIQNQLKTCDASTLNKEVTCCTELIRDGELPRKIEPNAYTGYRCVEGIKNVCSKLTF